MKGSKGDRGELLGSRTLHQPRWEDSHPCLIHSSKRLVTGGSACEKRGGEYSESGREDRRPEILESGGNEYLGIRHRVPEGVERSRVRKRVRSSYYHCDLRASHYADCMPSVDGG